MKHTLPHESLLKAQERIQNILKLEAEASQIIITAYNDVNRINRPGLTEEAVLLGCEKRLKIAINKIRLAKKLYESGATPELKPFISTHFEQRRLKTHYLQFVSTPRAQDGNDEE